MQPLLDKLDLMEGAGSQLILSGVAAGIVYFLYSAGKSQLDYATKEPVDPVITEAQARNIVLETPSYPSCEVWDPLHQVFVNAGDSESDSSQNACFLKHADRLNPRYAKSATEMIWKKEDTLKEDSLLAGTCFFKVPPRLPDFPDETLQTFPNYDGITPVNRSERLCFGAGSTKEGSGYKFTNTATGITTLNPYYNLPNGVVEGSYPRCEKYVSGVNGQMSGWMLNPAATDQATCLNDSLTNRWRDDSQIVFTNPYTNKRVTTKNELF